MTIRNQRWKLWGNDKGKYGEGGETSTLTTTTTQPTKNTTQQSTNTLRHTSDNRADTAKQISLPDLAHPVAQPAGDPRDGAAHTPTQSADYPAYGAAYRVAYPA